MKKKILFVITKSNWGGAQRYVFDLATNLPKDRFDVAVALGGTGQADALQGTLDSKLRAAGIRSIFIPSFMRDVSLRREWKAYKELKEVILDEKPDVVHLNSSKAGGLGAMAAHMARWPIPEGMLRAKIIFTAHGLPWDEDRNVFSRTAILISSWITFLLCDKVIVISKDAQKRVRSLPFCSSKTVLVHNGLAPLPFLGREAARAKLNIRAPFSVYTIANLEWNKGLHYLIRAASVLKQHDKNFEVVIAGEGEERKFLETLIEEEDVADRVRLIGFTPDAWQYLEGFEALAIPSVKEGLPYVLLEAGQAGVPAVGSKIPGIEEIVGNRVSGLLFRPKDAHDMAHKLAELIDNQNLRTELAQNFKARVSSEFSIGNMVAQTAALY